MAGSEACPAHSPAYGHTADHYDLCLHRHHHHHRPKRGVIVVHRFASTDQVRTDSSIFNISLAMAESLHNNDYS